MRVTDILPVSRYNIGKESLQDTMPGILQQEVHNNGRKNDG